MYFLLTIIDKNELNVDNLRELSQMTTDINTINATNQEAITWLETIPMDLKNELTKFLGPFVSSYLLQINSFDFIAKQYSLYFTNGKLTAVVDAMRRGLMNTPQALRLFDEMNMYGKENFLELYRENDKVDLDRAHPARWITSLDKLPFLVMEALRKYRHPRKENKTMYECYGFKILFKDDDLYRAIHK
jgi:hypothetical protein